MAEVSVTAGSRRYDTTGNGKRVWRAKIDVAADADTISKSTHGLVVVESARFTSASNTGIGYTLSGSTVAVQTGGVENGVDVEIIGY